MARAAEAVGASPMSLYRHFTGKDDLLLAVTRHVVGDAHPPMPSDAPWEARIRAWMTTVYDKIVRYPQLFQQATSGESMAWLPEAGHLTAILEDAGFTDDRQLAEAVMWVGTTTLGQGMVAAAIGHDLTLPDLYAAVGHLTADEAARVARLVPHFAALGNASFAVVADLTIAALTSRLAILRGNGTGGATRPRRSRARVG